MKNRLNKPRNETITIEDERLLKLLGIEVDGVPVDKLKQATYFTCMRILTDNVSKLPLKLYETVKENSQVASGHYLNRLLKYRPNPYMSASDFWKAVEYQRNEHGNGLVYIHFNARGMVTGLYPLDFKQVEIWLDDAGVIGRRNAIWYIVKSKDGQTAFKAGAHEVLHFKGFTTNGLVGQSVKDNLKEVIENAQYAQNLTSTHFKTGLFAKGVLQYTGSLEDAGVKKMVQRFKDLAGGVKNAGGFLPLPLGFVFQPLNLKMADAQFVEIKEATIRDIAAAFGIKMHQLNNLERATHTNIAEQQKEFYIDTLQSIVTMYEQEITYKLLLDSEIDRGFYFRFNVDVILRADIKTRYESYRVGIQAGFLTPNEVRKKEELPEMPGGDQLIVNGSMQKLETVGNHYEKRG